MQALLDAMARATVGPEACRVFHGRGGLHPGCEHLSLDWLAPVWVLTSFEPLSDADLHAVGQALLAHGPSPHWVAQIRQAHSPSAQARVQTRLMAGTVPEAHWVAEQGAQYRVRVLQGQNHGLFLDMAAGRAWVRAHAQGARVLNLFAYTCAFSVAALQGGAASVINLDMASGALAVGRENHQRNGLVGAQFWAHDVFASWGKVRRHGPYDLVLVDPPSYQKGSFVAAKDYARVVRRLPDLLAPGGRALLCLNAPEFPSRFLTDLVAQEAPELRWVQRLANPAAFADVDPERALKVLVFERPT